MQSERYGEVAGKEVRLFTLVSGSGLRARVTNYGATLVELLAPDRNGALENVVLGFEALEHYVEQRVFFGATVGRIANRLAGAQLHFLGKTYPLAANDPPHHLHGGLDGWDRRVWDAEEVMHEGRPALQLRLSSPAGDEGYPGAVEAQVLYQLTDDSELRVEMSATANEPTVVGMAHHSYWNLGGPSRSDVLQHRLRLWSDEYTPGNPVPDGRVQSVAATPFDFRTERAVAERLQGTRDHVPAGNPVGYDHNWIVRGTPGELRPVAELSEPHSGRRLELLSDAPGVQFYSGNFLDGSLVGATRSVGKHAGLCLETQAFPNAANVPQWESQVQVVPGQRYVHRMVHRFSVAG